MGRGLSVGRWGNEAYPILLVLVRYPFIYNIHRWIRDVSVLGIAMRAARIDANQPAIVAALRKAGCTVQHLHSVGKGCPDLLVGKSGINYLLECKDGAKSPSEQRLTPDQVVWHGEWGGSVAVVNCEEAALKAVGL